MVAVANQGQSGRVGGKMFKKFQRMAPWRGVIPHALKNPDGTPGAELAAQDQMTAPVFEKTPCKDVVLVPPHPIARQRRPYLFGKVGPDQLLGKIGRRGDQDHARKPPGLAQPRQGARQQQRDPAPHG